MRVAVIGAGPAGLSFADRLLSIEPTAKIDIYEKSCYIGGLSKTVKYKGNRIDIGGHRFFSKSSEVMNWWAQKFPIEADTVSNNLQIKYRNQRRSIEGLNIADEVDIKRGRIMLLRNRKSRILYERKLYDYPLKLNLKTLRNIGFLKMITVSSSYLLSKLEYSSPKNLEEFIISRFGKKLYSMFFETYTYKVWGRHPKDISPEWGAQRIKGLSIRKLLVDVAKKSFNMLTKQTGEIAQKEIETTLIERFLYPKYGPGHMWEEVAKDLTEKGVEISLQTKVTGIVVSDDLDHVNQIQICTRDDKEVTINYDYVVSTMPISELVDAMLTKSPKGIIPDTVLQIASSLPYRDFITVGILLDCLVGPQGEDLDDTWIYIQEPDVKVGRIQIFNNWSPYLVSDPTKKWIGMEFFCNEGDDLWSMSDDAIINKAKEELVMLKLCSKKDIIDSTVIREAKTYPAYFDSYKDFKLLINVFDKIDNLFLIGRNGMHKYNNQDHSMLTGFKAAELIAGKRTRPSDKNIIWDINAEQEYHEE